MNKGYYVTCNVCKGKGKLERQNYSGYYDQCYMCEGIGIIHQTKERKYIKTQIVIFTIFALLFVGWLLVQVL